MLESVRKTIDKYALINSGDKIIIGLSGGADSVCLTHILHTLKDELNLTIYTAHLNHGLRGEDADADERFAKNFSEGLGIKCIIRRADIKKYAKDNGLSEEMAGREVRYKFFEDIKNELGFDKIATAHNKNDNAETILMNFMRGSGLAGLCGIPAKRDSIIRPIIGLSRAEIEEYCTTNSLSYVTDKTNYSKDYMRNRIRLDLLPKIQKDFNPVLVNTITGNAELIADELDFIDNSVKEILKHADANYLDLSLLQCHIALKRRVILAMMKNAGISTPISAYVDAVINLVETGRTGASVNLSENIIAKIEYNRLYIGKDTVEAKPFEYVLNIGQETYIKELDAVLFAEYGDGEDVFDISESDTITVRNRRNGDYFYPSGMDGKKKLKSYFIDEKIPRAKRQNIGILTVNGEIAWIIGKRRDRRFIKNGRGVRIKLIPYRRKEDILCK